MNPRETRSVEETISLAQELAGEREDCRLFYLRGDLGAGKTLFAKGIAAHYGVDPSHVVSPTFSIVNRYSDGDRVLYHLDLYRIEDERELDELGIEEMEEEDAVLMIEWAEKIGRYARADATDVLIEVTGEDSRRIVVTRGNQEDLD